MKLAAENKEYKGITIGTRLVFIVSPSSSRLSLGLFGAGQRSDNSISLL